MTADWLMGHSETRRICSLSGAVYPKISGGTISTRRIQQDGSPLNISGLVRSDQTGRPCCATHPSLATVWPFVSPVERTDGWTERTQLFAPLRQKLRQNPIPADAEAVTPLDELLRDLTEVLPSEIGIPKPGIKICHWKHYPLAVLRSESVV